MSLKKKLLRMKPGVKEEEKTIPQEPEDVDKFKELGFYPFYLDGDISYRRKVLYPFTEENNLKASLEKLKNIWKMDEAAHPLHFSKEVGNLLFFDTETTGLSTGAGTMIFLIGYARVLEEGIEVTQHFLTGPEQEAAFMGGFLDDFSEEDIIVSYNGKSFDWPQVKSRHAFLRRELPKLPEAGHIDLLHAARRFWKNELPSCRLAVVEEHKLLIKRHNDTPGSLAPLLYFDYVHSKDPFPLKGIIDHHEQDVISLVRLYILLAEKACTYAEHTSAAEHEAAAHWWESLKQWERAEHHWRLADKLADKPSSQRLYRMALNLRKQNKVVKAITILESLQAAKYPHAEAMEELAKYYENTEKNLDKALKAVETGLTSAAPEKTVLKLRKRRDRIRTKKEKTR
ncbi:ribonuclease H-like domain-containing protein [Alkalicoccus daliensis]|uniref:YprB ribonuclease H-like domain-containing protein n=1 Tax=Alkalicoccus daliensis TaxID=745820 RepID=A0A1H0AF51_9BACI|nr:ribonuclease H-like domain-containing protein [Alkalicoccus daliensis]SDN32238.1 hypothetical protein SAMN04488053_101465 [Alkalicoccus daliensis]